MSAFNGSIQGHLVLHSVENFVMYLNEPDSLLFRSIAFLYSFRLFLRYFNVIFRISSFFFGSFLYDSLQTFLKNENIVSCGTSFLL